MADKERKLKWLLWADAVKFKEGLNKAKKDLGGFERSAKSTFSNFAASLGAALSVGALVSFTKDLAKLSGEVEGVATAFSKIGNQADLQNLRNQVKGTVSDLQLMKMSVMANTLGLPIQNLGNLFEFAAKMAQDTGQSVDYLVDSIVRGIGRKSALILDNLGISAIQLKEKLGGVSVEAASVGQVTEAVSKIAEEYLVRNGGLLDTNATKIQRISSEWENFKSSLATSPNFTSWVSEGLKEIEALFSGYASLGDLIKGVFSQGSWDKLMAGFENWKQIQEWNTKYGGMYGEGESTTQIKATAKAIDETSKSLKKAKTAYELLSEELTELIKQQKSYATQNKDISDVTARIAALQLEIDKIDQLIEKKTESAKWDAQYKGTYTPATSIQQQGTKGVKGEGLDTKGLTGISDYLNKNIQEVNDYLSQVENLGQQVAYTIQGAFENMAMGVSEAFANLASGTGTLSDVAKALMTPIADLAISLGTILIGVGTGIEGLKTALATIHGPIALAAGAALIALGVAAKAGVASLGTGGGGASYSGSSGTYDTRTFSQQQQYQMKSSSMKVEVVGTTQIRNKDIYIAYQNAQNNRKLST